MLGTRPSMTVVGLGTILDKHIHNLLKKDGNPTLRVILGLVPRI